MNKSTLFTFSITFVIGTVLISGAISETGERSENGTSIHAGPRTGDRRPSFWTKAANNLKASALLRMYKPYSNPAKLQKRISPDQTDNVQYTTENHSARLPKREEQKIGGVAQESTTENQNFETTTLSIANADDLEVEIMKDESIAGLKEFANRLLNDTAKLFVRKNGQQRSYPVDEHPQHQLWDDKDQTYHASTFAASDYEPFHHHYIPPPPLHYHPPPKKEDALLSKVAMIALLKLILAKLKAIGFLKLMFLFMMKVPILFFKFLFVLKSFKLLKLISIPFIIASFAAPFLPLLPFLAPLLLAPLLFAPLLLPLLIPLLFFLPIIPVSTPSTASSTTMRRKREATFNAPILGRTGNETRARYMRIRPASYENRKIFEHSEKLNRYEENEDSPNLLQLTQKLVESQHCIERVACELASQNDSKMYQAAVIWALEKANDFATSQVKRKIERYADAYKTGIKWQTPDICRNNFPCQRPRILLVQGKARYNVF